MDKPLNGRAMRLSPSRFLSWTIFAALLIGLAVVFRFYFKAKTDRNLKGTTEAWIRVLQIGFETYRSEFDTYPVETGAKICPCAPLGSDSDDGEETREIVRALKKSNCVNVRGLDHVSGHLADHWNRKLVVRVLYLPSKNDEENHLEGKLFIWSYGPDGKNGVSATPNYVRQGPPDYDKSEIERMEASPDPNSDDICSWR